MVRLDFVSKKYVFLQPEIMENDLKKLNHGKEK